MISQYKYFFLIIIFLLSCYPIKSKSYNLISKKVMVNILYDIYIYKEIQYKNCNYINNNQLINLILKKYNITFLQYKNSFIFYYLNNNIINIYIEVKNKIQNSIENI